MLLNRKVSILYFINLIKGQLLLIILFSLSIAYIHFRPAFDNISVPFNVLSVLGTIVSILLAFRTSQSYERWWEARIVWGGIVNDSRTLVRQAQQFLLSNDRQEAEIIAERQIIWFFALGEALRRQPFSEKVQSFLDQNKIKAQNIPNALLDAHSEQIRNMFELGKISEFKQLQLNETITRLCDSMGKCERIKNTVFPRSYSLMLHTLIYTFAALLPFGLTHDQIIVEIIISITIPVMFISVEKTAIIMQDPFENTPVDTPMTSLAQTIEINIREMLGESNVPQKKDNGLYYEM